MTTTTGRMPLIGKKPKSAQIDIAHKTHDLMVVEVRGIDATILEDGFLVLADGYTIGTLQIADETGTLLSTGAVEVCVANDPYGGQAVAHPDAVSLSAAGTTDQFAMKHAYVGARVKTVQSGVRLAAYLVLRRHRLLSSGGSVTVPGSDTQIVYNNAGALGASADFKFDAANASLTIGGAEAGDILLKYRSSDGERSSLYFDNEAFSGFGLGFSPPTTLTAFRSISLPDLDGTVAIIGATNAGNFSVSGNVILVAAGNGISIAEGSDATMGVATLSGGTVTVSTAAVTANSRIFLTVQSLGTVAVAKAIAVTARTASTSFTITSADATDTSVVAWVILEPA